MISAAVASSAAAQTGCLLCSAPVEGAKLNKVMRPLRVDIETSLDFSLAAHTSVGSGSIEINPQTGERRVIGGLVALGGSSMRGIVSVEGEPFARLTVTMPQSIKLNSARGDKAEVVDIKTSLASDPMIGADGRLSFSFGGRLVVENGATGSFRGRIHINVDYQ
jgi:Domain of unknown function (DUF4402)